MIGASERRTVHSQPLEAVYRLMALEISNNEEATRSLKSRIARAVTPEPRVEVLVPCGVPEGAGGVVSPSPSVALTRPFPPRKRRQICTFTESQVAWRAVRCVSTRRDAAKNSVQRRPPPSTPSKAPAVSEEPRRVSVPACVSRFVVVVVPSRAGVVASVSGKCYASLMAMYRLSALRRQLDSKTSQYPLREREKLMGQESSTSRSRGYGDYSSRARRQDEEDVLHRYSSRSRTLPIPPPRDSGWVAARRAVGDVSLGGRVLWHEAACGCRGRQWRRAKVEAAISPSSGAD
ncbi:hypothetical protein O3P69_016568 [Scylla paramamosain]|uniref:Uncharacterized protein n=1 Tax=Scylla paramamosain TaxID=85552 RepID=A0AAW0SYB6_SCYPA